MDLFPLNDRAGAFPGLRPKLTQEAAANAFTGQRHGFLGRLRHRRLHSVALVYVPYHVFRVEIADRSRRQTSYFALDAVSGTLDPYRFDEAPRTIDVDSSTAPNRLSPVLGIDDAWRVLGERLQRLVFQTGFFRLRDPRISGERAPVDLHVPYWIGIYDDGGRVRLEVIDAARGRFEGAKARELFETWLSR